MRNYIHFSLHCFTFGRVEKNNLSNYLYVYIFDVLGGVQYGNIFVFSKFVLFGKLLIEIQVHCQVLTVAVVHSHCEGQSPSLALG